MTTFEAIILGLIQGITEFLPVSSSGHLVLSQHFFGLHNLDQYVLFDVILHVGTLLAIFCVFHRMVGRARLFQVVLGTLPLFPMVFLLKQIKGMFDQTQYLGYFFLLTGFLLYMGSRGVELPPKKLEKKKWRDAIVIGLFQVLALLPGVSRSGSTISGARLLGWSKEDAVHFSFLLAIPAILGSTFLESMHVLRNGYNGPDIHLAQYVVGFFTAFIVGYASLKLLIKLVINEKIHYFIWYCLAIGLFSLFYFS